MATFREARDALLLAHDDNVILNDLNTSKNLNFPYWQHDSFELGFLEMINTDLLKF